MEELKDIKILGKYKLALYKVCEEINLSPTRYEVLLYIGSLECVSMAWLIEHFPATSKTLYDSIKILQDKELIQILKEKTKYGKRLFSITGLGRKYTYKLIEMLTPKIN